MYSIFSHVYGLARPRATWIQTILNNGSLRGICSSKNDQIILKKHVGDGGAVPSNSDTFEVPIGFFSKKTHGQDFKAHNEQERERGSPCVKPPKEGKRPKGLPLMRTEKDGKKMQILTQLTQVKPQLVHDCENIFPFHYVKSFIHISLNSHEAPCLFCSW